ncbi:MAG: DotU family type IV/VI secretion system protein [Aestuariivita sp.]|nr:DotU family type IV/VI secretion system protein [Aestuariivita sp.]
MNLGYIVAIHAIPFFNLLDSEVEKVAEAVFGSPNDHENIDEAGTDTVYNKALDSRAVSIVMENCRRRLAQGVDAFVRRLPTSIRNDSSVTRAAAYALVGLSDERMLHYPSGGLTAWRDQLLESELYGSALAGQELIRQARLSTQGSFSNENSGDLLSPLYLAILREGFEGSLRGDVLGLSSLTTTLEDNVGRNSQKSSDLPVDSRPPKRTGLPSSFLAVVGLALWLASGFAVWAVLGYDSLEDANRVAKRIEAGLAADFGEEPTRTIEPTDLP